MLTLFKCSSSTPLREKASPKRLLAIQCWEQSGELHHTSGSETSFPYVQPIEAPSFLPQCGSPLLPCSMPYLPQ